MKEPRVLRGSLFLGRTSRLCGQQRNPSLVQAGKPLFEAHGTGRLRFAVTTITIAADHGRHGIFPRDAGGILHAPHPRLDDRRRLGGDFEKPHRRAGVRPPLRPAQAPADRGAVTPIVSLAPTWRFGRISIRPVAVKRFPEAKYCKLASRWSVGADLSNARAEEQTTPKQKKRPQFSPAGMWRLEVSWAVMSLSTRI